MRTGKSSPRGQKHNAPPGHLLGHARARGQEKSEIQKKKQQRKPASSIFVWDKFVPSGIILFFSPLRPLSVNCNQRAKRQWGVWVWAPPPRASCKYFCFGLLPRRLAPSRVESRANRANSGKRYRPVFRLHASRFRAPLRWRRRVTPCLPLCQISPNLLSTNIYF